MNQKIDEIKVISHFLRNCPHCSNEVIHFLILRYQLGEWDYLVYRCTTCGKITLTLYENYSSCTRDIEDVLNNINNYTNDQIVLYPSSGEIPLSIPSNISSTYKEAISIKGKSPNGFAGLIRKSLEYVLQEQNAEGKTLYERINDLAKKNILPPTIIDMSDLIRIIGNIGVHAGSEDVTKEQTDLIDKFFNLILEYVYVAPAKVKELQEQLEKNKIKSS